MTKYLVSVRLEPLLGLQLRVSGAISCRCVCNNAAAYVIQELGAVVASHIGHQSSCNFLQNLYGGQYTIVSREDSYITGTSQ